jgi:DMSO/TMAO reductase YedYZ molybdopterin-dependent catalytic subunit
MMDLKTDPDDRRGFLRSLGMAWAGAGLWGSRLFEGPALAAEGDNPLLSGRPLVRYPGKTDLILLTSRPPQLETPISYFENAITPNEAFYVRYHIDPPTRVDLSTWRLKIGGHVEKPLELSLNDLQTRFDRTSIVAVNQCSGNGRGYSAPRVFGGQWANGAMGNAEWTGARLRDVLSAAGIKPGAVDVSFDGLDRPNVAGVPDFVKSLTASRIMGDPSVLLAYQMNGQPLPMLNGFPVRLVVPGWYGTYWVKHLTEITVLDKEFDGFWMKKAYLIPDTPCGCVEAGSTPAHTVPINRMNVRSVIVRPQDGARLQAGKAMTIRGIAFDSGAGIQDVTVSTDRGASWRPAQLGQDLGNYSFREWSFRWSPQRAMRYSIMVRATSRIGESQPSEPLWNPAGYLRNVVERVDVTAG